MAIENFGKARFYECSSCGGNPIRPLAGEPKPCDICNADLSCLPYTVGDLTVFARDVIRRVNRRGDAR